METPLLTEGTKKKWEPVIAHPELPTIRDAHRRYVTTVMLENQQKFLQRERSGGYLAEAAPTVHAGTFPNDTNLKGYDPILISLVRRTMPQLIAFDVCGVQPLAGPTGLIFAMKARYDNMGGQEALFNEPITTHSGKGDQLGVSPLPMDPDTGAPPYPANAYTTGSGMTTLEGESLGDGADPEWNEMAFSIDKVTVTAVTRALKAEYTTEIAQDLQAVHGLDAETELANILSAEILAEINREIIRTIYRVAVPGAQHNLTVPGIFNLDADSNGRWLVERFKGMMFQIEREANAIAKATRRGRGNFLITSSDVASALSMAGFLDSTPALAGQNNWTPDDSGDTFVGVLNGRFRVYIDPYIPVSATNYFVVGYKGPSPMDAGLFYCPYVPLQMVRAIGDTTFQPKIAFKTRYGIVVNPFSNSTGDSDGTPMQNSNLYYRKVQVDSLT